MPLRASWAILATHEGQGRGVSEVRFQGIVEPHQSHLRVHGGPDGLVELFIYGRVAAPDEARRGPSWALPRMLSAAALIAQEPPTRSITR